MHSSIPGMHTCGGSTKAKPIADARKDLVERNRNATGPLASILSAVMWAVRETKDDAVPCSTLYTVAGRLIEDSAYTRVLKGFKIEARGVFTCWSSTGYGLDVTSSQ